MGLDYQTCDFRRKRVICNKNTGGQVSWYGWGSTNIFFSVAEIQENIMGYKAKYPLKNS
jgi:hypothetical protein